MNGEKETILVVDDEATIRSVLGNLLVSLGYNYYLVPSAEDAIKRIEEEEKKIDLILLDAVMAGMGGVALLKKKKNIFPNIDVILMTAYSQDFTYVDIIKMGCCDLLLKPFRIMEVEIKIKRILRERELLKSLMKVRYVNENLKREIKNLHGGSSILEHT